MSRWIETGEDEYGRYYIETLADPDECALEVNEVCCNHLSELCADFPMEEDCEKCLLFEPETKEGIEALTKGVKTYEQPPTTDSQGTDSTG